MEKQIIISDTYCISKEWLDKEIRKQNKLYKQAIRHSCTGTSYSDKLSVLENIKSQLFPLDPIVKDAWGNGQAVGYILGHEEKSNELMEIYLPQPITIKIEDNVEM